MRCLVLVHLAHARTSTATIAFTAERWSAGRHAGDSLVADAFVRSGGTQMAKAVMSDWLASAAMQDA